MDSWKLSLMTKAKLVSVPEKISSSEQTNGNWKSSNMCTKCWQFQFYINFMAFLSVGNISKCEQSECQNWQHSHRGDFSDTQSCTEGVES